MRLELSNMEEKDREADSVNAGPTVALVNDTCRQRIKGADSLPLSHTMRRNDIPTVK